MITYALALLPSSDRDEPLPVAGHIVERALAPAPQPHWELSDETETPDTIDMILNWPGLLRR